MDNESIYEEMTRPLDPDVARQVCELLGLDPNRTHKIILDSAPMPMELTTITVRGEIFEQINEGI